MLARSIARCRPRIALPDRRPARLHLSPARQVRHYVAPSSAPPATAPATSTAGMLAPFTSELDRIAPRFNLDGSRIRVLQTPAEFYVTLKDKIRGADRRIFLSTLYIGKTETELIEVLRTALKTKPCLKLYILTDYLRGTRESPNPCCASLLAPLIAEFGTDRVEVRMYHTPNLTGLRKRLVPKRVNEGWGLQHMKLYAIDDEIILSGANLSEDYFTNRQDRYHLFQSGEVTEHFWRLFRGVSRLSYLLEPHSLGEKGDDAGGFRLSWPTTNAAPAPLEQPKQFVASATKVLRNLVQPAPITMSKEAKEADTSVYIVTQLSQLLKPDTSTELPALTHVLKTLAQPNYAHSSWTFTAGYFNPAPSLTKLLISTASQHATVITASPQANGFYGSRGVSGLLPGGYTLLARRFLRSVHFAHRQDAITLKEWRRGTIGEPGGWTYHAKGLWVCMPGEADPSITLVGSSNYTKRSYGLDLEANALVVTRNEGLKRRLGQETRWLQEYAGVVTRDDLARNERRVGWDVRIAMAIVKLVGGAM